MGELTKIPWAHHTFNPWWGCEKVSPGCANCYAETWSKRTGFEIWGNVAPRRFFNDRHWTEPLKLNHALAPKEWDRQKMSPQELAQLPRQRVFCASMCDIMEDRRDLDDWRSKLYMYVEATPYLDWLFLTKRPENYARLLPAAWLKEPRENVWLGTTTENREQFLKRTTILAHTPAHVRFLSAEPLLESLGPFTSPSVSRINWIIFGGESGPGARDCYLRWIAEGVQECRKCRITPFVKQLGARPVIAQKQGTVHSVQFGEHTITPPGYRADAELIYHPKLKDKKGEDPAEWPEAFRVREFPAVKLSDQLFKKPEAKKEARA